MTLAIVVPMRPPAKGKTRLAAALSDDARTELSTQMFRHVLGCALRVAPKSCYVVSSDQTLLRQVEMTGARSIVEQDQGMNRALTQATAALDVNTPVLALSADLPHLDEMDIRAMMEMVKHHQVIAAPDHTGLGTNALMLARPGLIPYHFGESSLAAHRHEAEVRGLTFASCEREGLARDIDWPEDLDHLLAWESPARNVQGRDRIGLVRRDLLHGGESNEPIGEVGRNGCPQGLDSGCGCGELK